MNHIIQSIGTRFAVVLTFLALTLPFTACENFDEPEVSVSAEEILIGSGAANVPVTIYSNTSWTAKSDAAWCVLSVTSGKGTTEIQLMVEPNKSDKSRTANIAVSMGDGQRTNIRLTQNRLSDTEVRVTPKLITLSAAAAQGVGFTVTTQYKDAVVKAEVLGNAQWISKLTQNETITGYVKTVFYSFDVTKNTGAAERKAQIAVTVTFGRKTHEYIIEVIQNGLGAPAISTAANAYLMPTQTMHTQDLWAEEGDRDNVRYEVSVVSNQSGVDGDTAWLTGATVDTNGPTHTLRITAAANDTDEVREGEVLIVAFRDNATTKVGVHVVQSAYMSAGVQVPATLLTHTWATGEYLLPVNPVNRSNVSVVASSASWLHDARISDNAMLHYTLDAFDGATGEYREAVLTLKAANGNAEEAFVYLTVRQYAPNPAGIASVPQMLTYAGNASGGMFFIEAQNGSEVVATSGCDWITLGEREKGLVTYSLLPYDGSQGDFRDGTITLMAENDHANRQVYTVVIRQYAPPAAGLQLPTSVVTCTSAADRYMLQLNPVNGSRVSVANVNAAWVKSVDLAGDGSSISYSLDAFDGATGDSREAVITLRASNSHANASVHYLHIRQYAPQPAGIGSLPQMLSYGSGTSKGMFPVAAQNGSEIFVDTADAQQNAPQWITDLKYDAGLVTYTLQPYDGSQGDFRDGIILLRARNTHANEQAYIVVVRQYAPAAAGIDLPASVVTYPCYENYYSLPINPVNGSEVTIEECNAAWVTRIAVRDTKDAIDYRLDAYDGSAGAYRDAVITVKASNSHFNATYYYLFIRQFAPDPAGITSAPQMLTYNSNQQINQFMVGAQNGSQLIASTPNSSWIQKLTCDENGVVLFALEAYNGSTGTFREGLITLTASNDHANAQVYNVVIRQYAPSAPALDLPSSTVTCTSEGNVETGYMIPLNPKNGATATLLGNDSAGWIFDAAIDDSGVFTYKAAPYDGSEGAFREAVLTFKAAKSSYHQAAYYYLTIRQYAPDPAGITSAPQMVTYNNQETTGMFSVGAQNRSLVVPNTLASWITDVTNNNGTISYRLSAYDGSQGDFREGIITLKVSNAHANEQVYNVVVRQYAPKAAGAEVPASILTYRYENGTYDVMMNPLNRSILSIAGCDQAWVYDSRVRSANDGITFTLEEYDGSAGAFRDAVITIQARKEGNADVAFYFLTIRQFAPDPAGITSAPQMLTYNSNQQINQFMVGAQNGSQLFASTPNSSWIQKLTCDENGVVLFALEAYNGSTGTFREGLITLTASNDHANAQVYNVVIRQYGPQAAGIELPATTVTYSPVQQNHSLPVNMLNGSSATIIRSPAWMTTPAINTTTGLFTFGLEAYDGSAGAFREGIVAIKATNTHATATMAYLTVRQYAPAEAGLNSVPAMLTYASGDTAGHLSVAAQNSTVVNVRSNSAWITPSPYQNGVINFTMTAYDGAQGDFRDGTLILTASSDHADKRVYTVVVRQYAPKAAGMSGLPEYIGLGYQALVNQTLPIQALNGSTISVESAPAWITNCSVIDNSSLKYDVAEYTATANVSMGYFREGTVVLKARNTNRNPAYYYLTVRQYARSMAFLSVIQGDFSKVFTWAELCSGNNTYGGTSYANYTEARVELNNVPASGTVNWGVTGSATPLFLNFVKINDMSRHIFRTDPKPSGDISTSHTGTSTLTINVNSYPYVQTLTLTASYAQTVEHTHN